MNDSYLTIVIKCIIGYCTISVIDFESFNVDKKYQYKKLLDKKYFMMRWFYWNLKKG